MLTSTRTLNATPDDSGLRTYLALVDVERLIAGGMTVADGVALVAGCSGVSAERLAILLAERCIAYRRARQAIEQHHGQADTQGAP
jgi:hypothetical protein